MSLRPFFCYYGGKWRAAPRYPAPEHDAIVEPFAGAAGYATRYHDRKVVLVERDPVIAGLWKYLTKVSAEEIRALPDMPLDGTRARDLPVCQEAQWLIGFWLNKGAAAPMQTPAAWMRAGTHANSYWGERVRQRIASQVEKIRHWEVIEGSYENAPFLNATWFVDPPYEAAGKYYRFGSDKIEYEGLAAWCHSREGFVIVCENTGATWLPFEPFGSFKSNASKHGKGYSKEAIWTKRTLPFRSKLVSELKLTDEQVREAILSGLRDAG